MYLVGEKLSTGQTGLYDRAVHLMGQPITVLGKLGDSVLFSGLSSIQSDGEQMRHVTLRAMHLVALVTIPLAAALVVQAEGVTWLFLGDRFAEAAPAAQILFAAVAFRALTKLGDANLRALDGLRMGIAIKLAFFTTVGVGTYVALERGAGLTGVAWAVVAASALQWLLTTGWAMHRLQIRASQLALTLRAGLALALITSGWMLLLSLEWWEEALHGAFLGTMVLLGSPFWIAPRWTDPDGTFRASLGQRLPALFRRSWLK